MFQIKSEVVILYVKQLAEMYDSFHDPCKDYLYTVYYTFIIIHVLQLCLIS